LSFITCIYRSIVYSEEQLLDKYVPTFVLSKGTFAMRLVHYRVHRITNVKSYGCSLQLNYHLYQSLIIIRLEARLQPNIGFILRRVLAFLDFRPQ